MCRRVYHNGSDSRVIGFDVPHIPARSRCPLWGARGYCTGVSGVKSSISVCRGDHFSVQRDVTVFNQNPEDQYDFADGRDQREFDRVARGKYRAEAIDQIAESGNDEEGPQISWDVRCLYAR